MKAFSFVALSLLFSQLAQAKHLEMTSAEGINIKIDYTESTFQTPGCFRCNIVTSATPLKISIHSDQMTSTDKVHLVLMSYSHFDASPELKFMEHYESLLNQDGNSFSTIFNQLPISSEGYGGRGYYSQEIVIRVNGVPLINAETKSTQFNLDL